MKTSIFTHIIHIRRYYLDENLCYVYTVKSPQEIINFLDQHYEGYIKFCNAKAVCIDLEREHVISTGQRQRLESSQSVAESNRLFYQFLRNDPAPETLKGAAKVLKNASETTNTNKTFATSIETFLQSC